MPDDEDILERIKAAREALPPLERKRAAVREAQTKMDTFQKGGIHGGMWGFDEEGAGALNAATQGIANMLPKAVQGWLDIQQRPLAEAYRGARDERIASNAQAEAAAPGEFLRGELATGLVTGRALPRFNSGLLVKALEKVPKMGRLAAPVGRILTGALSGAGQGGLYAAGDSNADLTKGEVGQFAADVGRGAKWGSGVGGGLAALGEGAGALSEHYSKKAAAAQELADTMGAKEAASETMTAQGSARSATQQGNRMVENILRLEAAGNATPEQLATLKALREAGVMQHLEQQLMESMLTELPEKAGHIQTAKALASELSASQAERAAAAGERLRSPAEAWNQVKERVARYGPPAMGSAVGTLVGGAPGGMLGAGFGANTRPMRHALKRMMSHPSVAYPMSRAAESIAGGAADFLGAAAQTPSASTPFSPRTMPNMSVEPMPAYGEGEGQDEEALIRERLAALRKRKR